mmetsp:Transcript_15352/g.32800  ORF Transcript_15352/g.32800 Transcript_15352/m.32800 type:complete len:206 (-) Transcript_15352:387-1004(-)
MKHNQVNRWHQRLCEQKSRQQALFSPQLFNKVLETVSSGCMLPLQEPSNVSWRQTTSLMYLHLKMLNWTLMRSLQQILQILFPQPIYSAQQNKFQQQPSLAKTHPQHQIPVLATMSMLMRVAELAMSRVLNIEAQMEAGQPLWRPKLLWIELRPLPQHFKIRWAEHFELSHNARLQINERGPTTTWHPKVARESWATNKYQAWTT